LAQYYFLCCHTGTAQVSTNQSVSHQFICVLCKNIFGHPSTQLCVECCAVLNLFCRCAEPPSNAQWPRNDCRLQVVRLHGHIRGQDQRITHLLASPMFGNLAQTPTPRCLLPHHLHSCDALLLRNTRARASQSHQHKLLCHGAGCSVGFKQDQKQSEQEQAR
jgi:hypothetical protein